MKVIIDAGMSRPDEGLFCVCPVEQNDSGEIVSIIDGLGVIGTYIPADNEVVGIRHPDGPKAAEKWHRKHLYAIAVFFGVMRGSIYEAIFKILSENHPDDLKPIYGISELKEALRNSYDLILP